MSLDCAGDHQCDPPDATGPDLRWTCPDCGRFFSSMSQALLILESHKATIRRHSPNYDFDANYGWRSLSFRPAGDSE